MLLSKFFMEDRQTPIDIQTLVLPSQLRQELKAPLGRLIRGSPEETMKELKELISEERPTRIISVGDVVSENMSNHGILIHLAIVDNRVMRQQREPVVLKVNQVIHVKNPAGTITAEAWRALEEALKQEQVAKVVVEGEEDLLALVALLHAPINALIVYGQPFEGIVAVKVTQGKRQKVCHILEAMHPITKN